DHLEAGLRPDRGVARLGAQQSELTEVLILLEGIEHVLVARVVAPDDLRLAVRDHEERVGSFPLADDDVAPREREHLHARGRPRADDARHPAEPALAGLPLLGITPG